MRKLNTHEERQLAEISEWKEKKPGVLLRSASKALAPATWLFGKAVPEGAILAALEMSFTMAQKTIWRGDILRKADIDDIAELRSKDLALSDRLANGVRKWAIGTGAMEGAAADLIGAPGLAADIVIVITLSIRTIYKIGLCYGYDCDDPRERHFVQGVLAVAGANTLDERRNALYCQRSIENRAAKNGLGILVRVATGNQSFKEASRRLARQLGIKLGKRKSLAVIPVIGALVGGSANAWTLREVGWAARRSYQERWLIENKKIKEV
jgi:uncharacterized protein (DUF697 family)